MTTYKPKIDNAFCEAIYLDYMNNWLTISAIAEYYNVTKSAMLKVLDKGRKLNHSRGT